MLIPEILDNYYKEHVARKVIDRARIEYAMQPLIGFFKEVDHSEIGIEMCLEYREEREGISDGTVRVELTVLRSALNHARKRKRLLYGTMPSLELPQMTAAKPLWLYKDELESLFESAEKLDQRVLQFLQLAYHTAARKTAIETLLWTQVDLENARIDLQGAYPVAKNKKRPIVPVSAAMLEVLASMKSSAANQYVLGSANSIRPMLLKVAEAARLKDLPARNIRPAGRLSPHILRHTRATHLLQDGKPLWAVAGLLGDNPGTVARVYGHHCPNHLAEVLLA